LRQRVPHDCGHFVRIQRLITIAIATPNQGNHPLGKLAGPDPSVTIGVELEDMGNNCFDADAKRGKGSRRTRRREDPYLRRRPRCSGTDGRNGQHGT
jgi:hypothetical protein